MWGLRVIFMNEHGETMAANTLVIGGDNDPKIAETIDMEKAVDLAKECCFHVVEFETDNKTLAEVLNRKMKKKQYLTCLEVVLNFNAYMFRVRVGL